MNYAARLSVGAIALCTLAACGSDDANDPVSGSLCAENGVTAKVESNHPNGAHKLIIPVADVSAGVDKTYDIQGGNTGHGHFVTVAAADFEALDAGTVLNLVSTDIGATGKDHTHPVTISCNP